MEDRVIHKFIDKVKDKFTKSSKGCPSVTDYAFSPEEIADLNRQNKQKIQDLKQDVFAFKKEEINDVEQGIIFQEKAMDFLGNSRKIVGAESVGAKDEFGMEKVEKSLEKDADAEEKELVFQEGEQEVVSEKLIDSKNVELHVGMDIEEEGISSMSQQDMRDEKEKGSENIKKQENSYIHLSASNQKLIMEQWNKIETNVIDQDIIKGKDILNHNYTITYADEAARFVHDIRKKYEVVLCYLIGFNNEKKGIYDKVIFSSIMDDEWKFLKQYIKILEKIRNFKK